MTDTHNTPRAYTIQGFCSAFGIGKSYVYELISEGQLQIRKAGRRTLISAEEAERWLNSLPTDGGSQP